MDLNRVSTPSEVDRRATFVLIRSLPLPVLTLTMLRKNLSRQLLLNSSARNAIAGVACRIGLHVVGLSMNHKRSAAICKQ